MAHRAVIKKSDDWWIGWLIDLPGVNAQEKSRDELLESLRIGAEDMLATDIPFESFAKWQKTNNVVIPAKAGIQCFQ